MKHIAKELLNNPVKLSTRGFEVKVYKWIGAWVASVWILGEFEGYVGDRGGLVKRRDHARLYRSQELALNHGTGEALGVW